MKKVFIAVVLLTSLCYSGNLPIEYQIQKKYQRMKLVLNGDIRWNVSRMENTYDITLMGNEQNFIIKNINYNFRDGIIKKFNYKSSLEGTKKIVIELRNSVSDYHIYQDETSKNLYIEFYPDNKNGYVIAKNISAKKAVTAAKKQTSSPQPKQNVVNIPQIVLDQVGQTEQPKRDVEGKEVFAAEQQKPATSTSSAALWLVLVSLSILLTGGGFAVYTFLKRRSLQAAKLSRPSEQAVSVPDFRSYVEKAAEPIEEIPVRRNGIVVADDDAEALSQSIDFAEQYLRSQGELDLQQRLENMSSRTTQQKIETELPLLKRKDPTLLAQKLGLSVGELELVTRLQKFHKQHTAEVS